MCIEEENGGDKALLSRKFVHFSSDIYVSKYWEKDILSRIFFISPHCSIKVSGLQQSDSVMSLWESCYAVTIWYQDNYDDCQEITPIAIRDIKGMSELPQIQLPLWPDEGQINPKRCQKMCSKSTSGGEKHWCSFFPHPLI